MAAIVVVNMVRQQDRLAAGDSEFANQTEAGSIERIQELNFRFKPTGKGWVSMPPKPLNQDASLAYLRKKPNTWFIVIAEKLGVESGVNTEGLLAIAQATLRAAATDAQILRQSNETINGVEGIRYEADARVSGQSWHYSSWVTLHNGYSYQLMTMTDPSGRNQVSAIASEMCQGFYLIDKEAVAHAEGVHVVDNHTSPRWGYEVNFSLHPDWTRVTEEASEVPAADLNVAKMVDGHQVNFAVIPIELPVSDADPKRLLGSLVTSTFAFSDFKQLQRKAKQVSEKEYSGYEVEGRQQVDHLKYGYRMRLIKKDN